MFTKNRPFEGEDKGHAPPRPLSSELSIPPAPEQNRRPESASSTMRSSNLSTLASGVKYEGNISGAGELLIEGGLKGDVRVVQVTIGEAGSVEGAIHADVLHVRGRISGTIVAKQVHLYATARVDGDITQEQISIDKGAWFQGRCTQAKREPSAAAPSPVAAALDNPTLSKPQKLEAKTD